MADTKAKGARSFRHVLCVYPYRRELNSAGFFPPLGMEHIAAVIEPCADRIDLIDLRKEAGRTGDFLQPDTDLLCFSVNWDRDAEFLREEIRSAPPELLTFVGGRHATEDPERWLLDFPNIDAVVRGDGEEAVEEFCQGKPLEEIPGVSFRRDGQVQHNPNRELGEVRNDFHPNRKLRRYTYEACVERVSTGLEVDVVASSRGCPYNCKFCSFNRNPWGEKRAWTARSPESVVDEIAEISAPIVGFTDDLFTFDMDRVERICDLLIERGIRKKYFFNARLEIAKKPDVLEKMTRAGFMMALLGIESAHDKTLQSMGKGFNTEKIREYCSVIREFPMLMHGYFILGCIGESVEEMECIVPFAHEIGIDTLGLSMLRVSPYSGLEELVEQNPEYHIAPGGKIYSDHCPLSELRKLRRQINRQFYSTRQIIQIMGKGQRIGLAGLLPTILRHLPSFSWGLAKHYRQRAKHHRDKRRAKRKAACNKES